jgi:hypothetical protein
LNWLVIQKAELYLPELISGGLLSASFIRELTEQQNNPVNPV